MASGGSNSAVNLSTSSMSQPMSWPLPNQSVIEPQAEVSQGTTASAVSRSPMCAPSRPALLLAFGARIACPRGRSRHSSHSHASLHRAADISTRSRPSFCKCGPSFRNSGPGPGFQSAHRITSAYLERWRDPCGNLTHGVVIAHTAQRGHQRRMQKSAEDPFAGGSTGGSGC